MKGHLGIDKKIFRDRYNTLLHIKYKTLDKLPIIRLLLYINTTGFPVVEKKKHLKIDRKGR